MQSASMPSGSLQPADAEAGCVASTTAGAVAGQQIVAALAGLPSRGDSGRAASSQCTDLSGRKRLRVSDVLERSTAQRLAEADGVATSGPSAALQGVPTAIAMFTSTLAGAAVDSLTGSTTMTAIETAETVAANASAAQAPVELAQLPAPPGASATGHAGLAGSQAVTSTVAPVGLPPGDAPAAGGEWQHALATQGHDRRRLRQLEREHNLQVRFPLSPLNHRLFCVLQHLACLWLHTLHLVQQRDAWLPVRMCVAFQGCWVHACVAP